METAQAHETSRESMRKENKNSKAVQTSAVHDLKEQCIRSAEGFLDLKKRKSGFTVHRGVLKMVTGGAGLLGWAPIKKRKEYVVAFPP